MTATPALTDEQRAWVDGLRDLADWLAGHPDYIRSAGLYVNQYVGPEAIAEAARALGKADKRAGGDWFGLIRDFGPHELHIFTGRDEVCERVVVATETVEVTEPDPEAVAALPTVTRTETREVVEWRCPESILRVDRAVAGARDRVDRDFAKAQAQVTS